MTAEVGPAIGLRTRTGSSALTDLDEEEDESSTDNDTEPEAEAEAWSSSSSSTSTSSTSPSSRSTSRQGGYSNHLAALGKHQPASSLLGGSLSATLRNALDLFVSSTPLTETD